MDKVSDEAVPRLDAEKGELRVPSGEDWVMISGKALRRVCENELTVLGSDTLVIWCNAGRRRETEGEKFAPVPLRVEATAFEVACEAADRDSCDFNVSWKLPASQADKARGPSLEREHFHNNPYAY